MKAYICDHCGQRAEPRDNDMVPNGWYTLTQYYKPDGSYNNPTTRHFCRPGCTITHLSEALPAIEPPSMVAQAIDAEREINDAVL